MQRIVDFRAIARLLAAGPAIGCLGGLMLAGVLVSGSPTNQAYTGWILFFAAGLGAVGGLVNIVACLLITRGSARLFQGRRRLVWFVLLPGALAALETLFVVSRFVPSPLWVTLSALIAFLSQSGGLMAVYRSSIDRPKIQDASSRP
ncbi:hypothetical protein [Quadrisphaera setariae]|uniref:Uncharacterized protein n=1 Tax=Quadrisphaera setariae TaxID=2593304 RepID=A0A5C8ZKU1_9ACTN|nr:hypothetical protein [Quadrisphaera setariae]TXR57576.1 hypothetical protein FMM08_04990 [Quadrisphaera setariae]